ncbi:DNA-directed RNA polymerases IV and V subunit 4, partial [Cucurbita argyrosperma subsp. sororia]
VPAADTHGIGVYLSPLRLASFMVEAGSQQSHPSSTEFDTGVDDPTCPKRKIGKDVLVKRLRSIAGDDMLLSLIRENSRMSMSFLAGWKDGDRLLRDWCPGPVYLDDRSLAENICIQSLMLMLSGSGGDSELPFVLARKMCRFPSKRSSWIGERRLSSSPIFLGDPKVGSSEFQGLCETFSGHTRISLGVGFALRSTIFNNVGKGEKGFPVQKKPGKSSLKSSVPRMVSYCDLGKGGKGINELGKASVSKEQQPLELKIEQELPKNVKCQCLMDCEAAQLLQGIQDQMVLLSADPTIKIPTSFDRGLQYAKRANHYVNTESVRPVLEYP